MRIFKNKLTKLSQIAYLTDYYCFVRSKMDYKGKKRYGTFYYCDRMDEQLKNFDNVLFMRARSEYAPEQQKKVIFIFD